LIKHLKNKSITDYHQACNLEPYPRPLKARDPDSRDIEFTVRPMKPSEAIEVSKCVYKAYGHSYGNENAYYPERLIELNKSGQLYSVVAVSRSNEIMGHLALQYWKGNSRIAEMCQGVVKPEFRIRRCFTRLTEYLIEKAKSDGLVGTFAQAVSNHTYSQRVGHRLGLKDCAIILAYVPSTTSFLGMTETPSQRVSLIVQFIYLNRPPEVSLYHPFGHETILRKLYGNLGISCNANIPKGLKCETAQGKSMIKTKVFGLINFARIEIEHYGENIVREVETILRELCLRKFEVLSLSLDLSDPLTYNFIEQFEKLGFFFAGLLPGGGSRGDALILQYLNNVPIDYADIHVVSNVADELVSYIKSQDPNLSKP